MNELMKTLKAVFFTTLRIYMRPESIVIFWETDFSRVSFSCISL